MRNLHKQQGFADLVLLGVLSGIVALAAAAWYFFFSEKREDWQKP